MKNYLKYKIDLQLLALLHLAITAIILTLFTISPGCTDELDDLGGSTLGPEATTSEVAMAFFKAISESTVNNMQKNSAVLYEYNQRVELGSIQKTNEVITIIDDKIDEDENYKVTFSIIETQFDDHGNVAERKPKKQYIENIPKNQVLLPLSTQNESASQLSRIKPNSSKMEILNFIEQSRPQPFTKDVTPQQEYVRISFHDLSVKKFKQSPPQVVREAENCLDIKNCELEVTEISFQLVRWLNATDWVKERHIFTMSNDSPAFIGGKVSHCASKFFNLGPDSDGKEKQVFATLCEVLRDFRYH